jgi:hypothetical protein
LSSTTLASRRLFGSFCIVVGVLGIYQAGNSFVVRCLNLTDFANCLGYYQGCSRGINSIIVGSRRLSWLLLGLEQGATKERRKPKEHDNDDASSGDEASTLRYGL